MPKISLVHVDREQIEALLGISFGRDPDPLMADPNAAYAPAWDAHAQPFGIFIENQLVGLYCLTTSENGEKFLLGGYLIKERYQEHGYGQTTLIEILKKISQDHPYCQTINLAVEPQNIVVKRLCQKLASHATI